MNIWMDAGDYQPIRRSRWKCILGGALYFIVCILALVVGALQGLMNDNPLMGQHFKQKFAPFLVEDPFGNKEEFIILALGTDRDYDERGRVVSGSARADSIQLIRLDLKNNAVGIFGIPRDTYVDIEGYKAMKINELHKFGGAEAVAQAVYDLVGIKPDKIVEVDFEFVKQAVDSVGGVEIFVSKRMHYTDRSGKLFIDFQPGRTKLDGERALGFVRYRQDSEIDRGRRQQDFLIAFKRAVAQRPETLPELSKLVMDTLDDYLTEEEVYAIAEFARTVPTSKVRHGTLPVREGPMHPKFYYYPIREDIPKALVDAGLKQDFSASGQVSKR